MREDFDLAVRYGRGVYPGLHTELCLPVEVFPVCSPALASDPARPLRVPADLRRHTLLHDDSSYPDVSNPNWAMWLERAGVTDVDAARGPSFWPSHCRTCWGVPPSLTGKPSARVGPSTGCSIVNTMLRACACSLSRASA